jgi:hypothetical protein
MPLLSEVLAGLAARQVRAFYNRQAMKTPHYTRGQALPEILQHRIMVLDGAMGTMIQRFKLDEAQYRG